MSSLSRTTRMAGSKGPHPRLLKAVDIGGTYLLLVAFAAVFAFPLLFMMVSSFKPDQQIFEDLRNGRSLLPSAGMSLDNYAQMFERSKFWLFFQNSLWMSVAAVIGGLVVNSLAAYVLARLKWAGRSVVLAIIIATMIIPFETIAIPLLLVVSKLPMPVFEAGHLALKGGWLNTYAVQVVPGIASVFNIFLFYQFFIDLPKELDEAAVMDGASPWRIFWSIVLPMSRPVLATVAILTFLGSWNSYLWPLMVTQSESVRPLMPAIQNFQGRTPEWGQQMAFITMSTLPELVVFFIFQKWFIKSIASSAVKG